MLKKPLYRLLILSANLFLISFFYERQELLFSDISGTKEFIAGISLDSIKIHGLQEMYFTLKDKPDQQSQFHEEFETFHDINFD